MTEWITITIDGKEIQAIKGELLTDAAARAGITIPVFCSHPKLDPLGACRMCLVEADGPRGRALITACTTPVAPGAAYHYKSERATDARQGTLELILINHPLDCPICDKGGECPLQNQTMEHGPGKSHFWEVKTHKAKNYDLSDRIVLDQERCIVCWRCIRYLQEWEDKPQLGLFHRGGETVIDKFPNAEVDAYTSGSIIDLCPVGALTNRHARFTYRPWELEKTDSICTHCAQGCNLRIDARSHTVRRNVGRENLAVNEEWICDKGRFATGFSEHPDRLQQPLVRKNGRLEPVEWPDAIRFIADSLKRIAQQHGPETVGAIGSAKVSNEANYLLGKFMRALIGTNNLDFREGSAVITDGRGLPALADAHDADLIVLLGCDPAEEAPVLANFLKRAAIRKRAPMLIVHPRAIELTQYPGVFLQPAPGEETLVFAALTRATLQQREEKVPAWLSKIPAPALPAEVIQQAAAALLKAERPFVIYGQDYASGPGAADAVAALSNWVNAAGHGERLGFLHSQANAQGAGDVGMLPDQLPGRRALDDAAARAELEALWDAPLPASPGLSFGGMIAAADSGQLKALYIMGSDPVGEKPALAGALRKLDLLIVQDLFLTPTAKLADVVLPAASYVESAGTFTNTERRVQRAPQAIRPVGKAVADWAILMHLARRYAPAQPGAWQTPTPEAVFAEMAQAVPQYAGISWESLGDQGQQVARESANDSGSLQKHGAATLAAVAGFPLRLSVGNLLWDGGTVFAATPEMTNLAGRSVRLHPADAATLGLSDGEQIEIRSRAGAIRAGLRLDSGVKPGVLFVPFSLPDAPVGQLFDGDGPHTAVAVQKVTG